MNDIIGKGTITIHAQKIVLKGEIEMHLSCLYLFIYMDG